MVCRATTFNVLTLRRFRDADLQKDGRLSSRIEIDVLLRGTDADPAKTFRLYFDRMKKKVIDFRKAMAEASEAPSWMIRHANRKPPQLGRLSLGRKRWADSPEIQSYTLPASMEVRVMSCCPLPDRL